MRANGASVPRSLGISLRASRRGAPQPGRRRWLPGTHTHASCAQRQASPSPRAGSGTASPPLLHNVPWAATHFPPPLSAAAPHAARKRPRRSPSSAPPSPAAAPSPSGYTTAFAAALHRSLWKGSAALAKSPGPFLCQTLPLLYPARTLLCPPVPRSAVAPLLEG